jgi:hypothetical protein
MKGPCSVEGCEKPQQARGLCPTHYQRQRLHGTTDGPTRINLGRSCSVDECDRDSASRGFCSTHYKRWLTRGDAGSASIRPKRNVGPCSVEGCTTDARDRGRCRMHAARLRRKGEVGSADKQHAVSYAEAECSVDGCGRRPKSRGLCGPHYKRWRRWGDPTVFRPTIPAAIRFAERTTVGAPPPERPGLGPCVLWTAGVTKQGYGSFVPDRGAQQLAHRWAYEQVNGEIPADHVIDHLCRVRRCVNAAHLEAVTNEENLRRGAGYGLQNGMRSACIRNHDYTPENTYIAPDGGIRCRTCARQRDRGRSRPNRKAA